MTNSSRSREAFEFTITRESGLTISVRSNDIDMNINELADLFKAFACAAGYSYESVDEIFNKEGE